MLSRWFPSLGLCEVALSPCLSSHLQIECWMPLETTSLDVLCIRMVRFYQNIWYRPLRNLGFNHMICNVLLSPTTVLWSIFSIHGEVHSCLPWNKNKVWKWGRCPIVAETRHWQNWMHLSYLCNLKKIVILFTNLRKNGVISTMVGKMEWMNARFGWGS